MKHEHLAAGRLQLVPQLCPETTAEYLDRWLSSRRSLRPATVRAYASHIRVHLIPHLGHIPLEQLTIRDVETMCDALWPGRA